MIEPPKVIITPEQKLRHNIHNQRQRRKKRAEYNNRIIMISLPDWENRTKQKRDNSKHWASYEQKKVKFPEDNFGILELLHC